MRRPLSRIRFRPFLLYLAAAGPGLIAANAGNDAGGVATYASAGAEFGYRPLFFMVLVTVGYVCIQEMVARLAAHTGKGLAALIREQFSLRLSAFAVLAFAIANVGLVVTEFAGIGTAFELFGVSRYLSVPIAAVAIWMLVIVGSYRYAERVFLLLSLVFITYPIAMLLGHPDWKAVAANTFIPHIIGSKAFLLVAVALIGTTITPYIQLYTAGAVVDRGIGPDEYKYERVDAVSGAIVSDIVSMCIIIATAAVLGGTGALSSAADAAKALEPVAGHVGRDAVRHRAARCLGPGRGGGAPVHLLRRGRGGGGGAVGVQELPSGPAVPRPVHRPDHHRRRGGAHPGEPVRPDHQHPGARGGGHPDHPDVRAGPGQPPLAAGSGGQRQAGPYRWAWSP